MADNPQEEEVPPTQFSQEEEPSTAVPQTPAPPIFRHDEEEVIAASVPRLPRGGSVAGSSAVSGLSRRMEDDLDEDGMMVLDENGNDGRGGINGEGGGGVEGEEETLIRGTNVHVHSAAEAFRDFLRNFVSVNESERRIRTAAASSANEEEEDSMVEDDEEEAAATRPLYLSRLEDILLKGVDGAAASDQHHSDSLTSGVIAGRLGVASLNLDALHLYFHSPACQRLYGWLVDYPAEIVPLMDILVGRELETLRDELKLKQEERMAEAESNGDSTTVEEAAAILELIPSVLPRVQVRPYHLRNLSHMRSLDPQSIDTLLSVRGMVVRTSPIIPDLKVAFFQCTICGHNEQITIDRGRIDEPTSCPTCHVRHGYSMVHNRCYFSDKQMVRVQETPDEVPAGETPASIVIFAYDDLVDAIR